MIPSLSPAALLLLVSVAPAGDGPPRSWTLPSGIRFEMSARELRATLQGATLFSTAALLEAAKREFDADAEERARELLGDDPPAYGEYVLDARTALRPLSVVGPLVSLHVTGDGYAPGATTRSGRSWTRSRPTRGSGNFVIPMPRRPPRWPS